MLQWTKIYQSQTKKSNRNEATLANEISKHNNEHAALGENSGSKKITMKKRIHVKKW